MSEHPIVTQLPTEQLLGYIVAMEEAAERARDTADQDWLTDRAAVARGILAREARAEAQLQAREFPFHLADNPDLTFDSVADMLEGCDAMHPIQFCQHGQPDRWAVLWPTADGGHEFTVYDSEQEADDFILSAGEADEAAPGPALADAVAADLAGATNPPTVKTIVAPIAAGLGIPPKQVAQDIAVAPPSSKPDIAEMRRLFESTDMTLAQIGERFGISNQGVSYHARTKGWQRAAPPPAPPPTPDDEAAARKDVLQRGRGAKWVAEEYGWTLPTAQEFCARVRAEHVAASEGRAA